MSDLLETLQWRYATKKMDPTKTVPQEKVERILEAVRLTASSSGLHPYEVFVVTNPALREQIKLSESELAAIGAAFAAASVHGARYPDTELAMVGL